MKLNLEFNNLSKASIKKSFFAKVMKETLGREEATLGKELVSASLAIVSEEDIRELNRRYRRKNQPTDVLSFAEFENKKAVRESQDKDIFLGEIVLCYHDIEKYACKNKLIFEFELAKVFSHGLLHLLGYSHGKKMFSLQESVAERSLGNI